MCLDITTTCPQSLASKEVARTVAMISKRLIANGTWPRSLPHDGSG
jgi:hypothetical protein